MDIGTELERIAERYGLQDVYVFGSRAREIAARVRGEEAGAPGTAPPPAPPAAPSPAALRPPQPAQPPRPLQPSDVDMAVQPLPGRALDARDRVRLVIEFEDLLSAPRVDLVVLSEASPVLAFEVVSGELIFTADPGAQAEHELYIMRRSADLAHLQRDRVREILTRGGR